MVFWCRSGLLLSSQLCAPFKTHGFTPELRSKAPPEPASHPPLPCSCRVSLHFWPSMTTYTSFTPSPASQGSEEETCPNMSYHTGQYRVVSHAGRGGRGPLPAPLRMLKEEPPFHFTEVLTAPS